MIARCHLDALRRAAETPRDADAFRALFESFPEVCPEEDCTAPSCREAVCDLLRAAWVQKGRK